MLIKLLVSLLAGWTISAIINYLADTLPASASGCPACGSKRHFAKNLLFFQPCKSCGYISRRPLVVFAVTVLGLFTAYQYGFQGITVAVMDTVVIAVYLLVIVIDLEHHLILHRVTLVGGLGFLIIGYLAHRIIPTLMGLLAGAIFFFIIYIIGQAYSKFKAKKTGQPVEDAIGFGDVTLSAITGLLVGWPNILPVLFYGVALGGISSLIYLLIQKVFRNTNVSQSFIPYGPFISVSALIFWFFTR